MDGWDAGEVIPGDDMPLKRSALAEEACLCGCCCGGWGAAAGLEAYSDKMLCLRSVLAGGPDAPVLEGLRGPALLPPPPKKSSPNKLSPGLVCFGGAAGALTGEGCLLTAGSVVLGLTGAETSSPNKSTSCGLALCWLGGGRPPLCPVCPFLIELPLARSCTTFRGTSSSPSSPSSVSGSGIGPSITHLRLSYLVRTKLSILLSFGTCPSASFASQYRFARLLPHFTILASCSSVHESRSMLLTREIWTPRLRWMPEQRMQMKIPRFQDAHRGCLLRLQSAQTLFAGSWTRLLRAARLRSVVSADAEAARRDIVVARIGGQAVCLVPLLLQCPMLLSTCLSQQDLLSYTRSNDRRCGELMR